MSNAGLPVWLDWVLYNTRSILLLPCANMQFLFADKCFLPRARLPAGQVNSGALRDVFRVLKAVRRRPRDLVARHETDTDMAGSVQVAKDILQKLRDLHNAHADNLKQTMVTLGARVYAGRPNADDLAETLMQKGDQALYAVKNDGGNQMFCFDVGRNAALAV